MENGVEYYPLTHPQKGIWYTEKMYPGTSIGNIAGTLRIKGKVDTAYLEKAINLFIEKNDAMRIRISEIDGEPRQYFSKYVYKKIDYLDFSDKDINELYKWDTIQTKIPFQLLDSELFYFAIVKINEYDCGFYIKCHHLICDAWSMCILGSRIVNHYSELTGSKPTFCENLSSYTDFMANENKYMLSERLTADRKYWSSLLESIPPMTELKHGSASEASIKSRRKTMLTPLKLSAKINQFCKERRVSVFALFTAALSMYINRVTAAEELILGTTTLNRLNAGEKSTVGMFDNINPMRFQINDEMNFTQLIDCISSEGLKLLKHQRYPFDYILKDVRETQEAVDKIFDIVINYQNSKFVKEDPLIEYFSRWHFNGCQVDSLHININDRENEGHLILDYDYKTELFHAKEIEFLHQNLINILWHALDDPNKKISQLEMLSEKEKHKILKDFSKTKIIYSGKKSDNRELKIPEKTKSFILDKNLNLMPIGIAGDLYISASNLSDKNKRDLQLKGIDPVKNPYLSDDVLYPTNITARWFPDGDILFLGKKDKHNPYTNETNSKKLNVGIISTFVSEPVNDYIKWWCSRFGYRANINFARYNQVFQELLNPDGMLNSNIDGINIVLIRLEDFIRFENGTDNSKIAILDNTYSDLKEAITEPKGFVPLIVGVFPASGNLSPLVRTHINNLNEKLIKSMERHRNIYFVELGGLNRTYSIEKVHDSIKDKEAHMPFSDEYYAALGTVLSRKIIALKKHNFKIAVLDCDNTLWKGICGELGPLGISITEAHRQFQQFLLMKHKEGMMLAVCSKNNSNDVFEVFDKNPDMLLKRDHIICWKVNWEEKSKNIAEISKELNIGLDSFIFIDDDKLECSKMVEYCPDILTMRFPSDERCILDFLQHNWAFDKVRVTIEDVQRNQMYLEEKRRNDYKNNELSIERFLKGLELKVSMRFLEDDEIPRAAQLTQRTNQFNLSTVRRNEDEIAAILHDHKYRCFAVEASDKFGDYGIIGLVILVDDGRRLFIDSFLMSCRIFGRNVENAIMYGIRRYAADLGRYEIEAAFVPSAKNDPFRQFIKMDNWRSLSKVDKRQLYSVGIENLTYSTEYIDFHYLQAYEKTDSTTANPNEFQNLQTLEELSPVSEASMQDTGKVYEIDVINNKNHNEYTIPLHYLTGRRLLNITSYKNFKPGNELNNLPENSTQEKLLFLWKNLLRTNEINLEDDFFEAGGDSLSAVILISRIYKEFGVELTLRDIFSCNTVSKLAQKIEESSIGIYRPITRISDMKTYYELSSAQKRMYILNKIESDTTVYNECHKIRIFGKLNIERLNNAFIQFINRHEIMRTGYEMFEGKPMQRILANVDFQLTLGKAKESDIDTDSFLQPFDLSNPPFIRAALFETGKDKYTLLIVIHHIIVDGASFGIMIKEIQAFYNEKELDPPEFQYKDFTYWQNAFLDSEEIKEQEKYWLDQFKDEIPVLNMPLSCSRKSAQSFSGKKSYFKISKGDYNKLKNVCSQTESTLFMLLFSAFSILLSRYSGQDDIVVGVPVTGRRHIDTKNIVGMLVNTLPIRTRPNGVSSYQTYLGEVKDTILKGLENQDYQLDKLVERLDFPRDLNRNPLFDVLFSLRNTDMPGFEFNGLTLEHSEVDNHKSKFDLSLLAVEKDMGVEFCLEYCTDLFDDDYICGFQRHFINILHEIIRDKQKRISELEIMDDREKNRILYEFNDTYADYPRDKTIHQLFEEQVERTPDNIAVVFGDKKLTYRELNAKANQLAWTLRDCGVKPDTIVAIMVERSLEMIIGILAILKAGGAYLPIDPEYPEERIKYMLDDSEAGILLTQTGLNERVRFSGVVLFINDQKNYDNNRDNLMILNKSEDMIYVIYTSGSTGEPKGVVIEHRNIVNFIYGINNRIRFSSDDTILCVTTFSFDIFVLETLLPLANGVRFILTDNNVKLDISLLKKVIFENNVTVLQMTPSRIGLVCDYARAKDIFSNVKIIMVGGEPLSESLLLKMKSMSNAKIYNMYGPTETSVWSSTMDLTNENKVSIGKPIDNTQFYVLDNNLKLVPCNIPGELYISGEGLSRGYLNRNELSKVKFIKSIFNENERMYRTGDIVICRSSGYYEFICRNDDQVKINGYRIELNEIKLCLLKYSGISDAIVLTDKIGEYIYLIACITSDELIDLYSLKAYLMTRIPNYMLPSKIIQLDRFPLLPNGKVNKGSLLGSAKKLDLLEQDLTKEDNLEDIILHCWRKILNNNIEADDNLFFSGGDSLAVIKIVSELLNHNISILPQQIYTYPTARKLAAAIRYKTEECDYSESKYPVVPFNYQYDHIRELKPFRYVLITGVTGFLGIHLLSEIIDQTNWKVYCLIRGDYASAELRLKKLLCYYFDGSYIDQINKRIFIICGDISSVNFGIEEELYNKIGEIIDLVIHSAAKVKNQGDYCEFEKVNVIGTKEIIDFCLKFRIKLAYISTLSVSGEYIVPHINNNSQFTEKDLFIGQKYLDNVYVRSKFEAECLILNSIARGLEATVLRLGFITGRYTDGKFQINSDENLFYDIMKAVISVGYVPVQIMDEFIDISPVDACANGIVKLLSKAQTYNRIIHFYNTNRLKISDLNILLNSNLEKKLEIIEKNCFRDYTKFIEGLGCSENDINFIKSNFNYERMFLDKKYRVEINNDISREYQETVCFKWPVVDRDYISKMLKYLL